MDIYDHYFVEIMMIMRRYHATVARLDKPEEILRVRREENKALAEAVRQQARALAHAAGEPVEPETHFATVIVQGVGGQ